MLNTKIIFVDGIPGSGKSTIAHFIARQLNKNGIKAKWFIEMERNHPLEELEKNEDESETDFAYKQLNNYPQRWLDFVIKAQDDDCVYIFESYPFQDILDFCLQIDMDRLSIKNYIHQLMSITSSLNPAIIHFYQSDVDQAIRKICLNRSNDWKMYAIENSENFLFCKNRNYIGETAFIKQCEEVVRISLELFSEFEIPKLQIENSAHDWDNYRKQILDFIEIPMIDELLYQSSYDRYCGYYSGKNYWLKIHVDGNRLWVDDSWANMKLLPLSEDEFEIEAIPAAFKFIWNESSEIKALIVTKSLCDYTEGEIFIKIIPVELSENDLQRFCGDFRCESENLDRKIYLKDGNLYYWRNEESESKLMPVSQNKLAMFGSTAMLEYTFDGGVKQILFTAQDDEDMIFVPA